MWATPAKHSLRKQPCDADILMKRASGNVKIEIKLHVSRVIIVSDGCGRYTCFTLTS